MEGFSIIGAKGFRQDESALQGAMERKNMRLDKYLKVSRIIKRRTVANEACDSGRVMLNDKVARASAEVKVGDVIEIAFGNKSVKVRITPSERKMPKKCLNTCKNPRDVSKRRGGRNAKKYRAG